MDSPRTRGGASGAHEIRRNLRPPTDSRKIPPPNVRWERPLPRTLGAKARLGRGHGSCLNLCTTMMISCESCHSKYSVADEKIRGKTVKIRCRECQTMMVAKGPD